MLFPVSELLGLRVQATDGYYGEIADCEFDNWEWLILYLLVDTGPAGRRFLPPLAFDEPDCEGRIFPTQLPLDQLADIALTESDEAVSIPLDDVPATREEPQAGVVSPGERRATSSARKPRRDLDDELAASFHLHQATEVPGYEIRTAEGQSLGRVVDLLISIELWRIQYLIVELECEGPAAQVVIPVDWIRQTDWNQRMIDLDHAQPEALRRPRYEPGLLRDKQYARSLSA